MKASLLAISALTLLGQLAQAGIPDRKFVGEGLIGITHSENFEYACDVSLKEENGELTPISVWIDDTFNKKGNGAPRVANFRVAHSFPFKMKVQNMVGVEVKINKASLGKCAKTCYALEGAVKVEDGKTEKIKYLFDETGMNTGKYTLRLTMASQTASGTCVLNEVP